MRKDRRSQVPPFLKSESQFNAGVLRNLEVIKGGIESLEVEKEKGRRIKDLIRLAFSSILVECSNLKRSPCPGYCNGRRVEDSTPFALMEKRINQIAEDLSIIQRGYRKFPVTGSEVVLSNAMWFGPDRSFDIVVTSPPYMNGLDYVMNYKIELGWLGFVNSQQELKRMKDEMVVRDNISKGLIQ